MPRDLSQRDRAVLYDRDIRAALKDVLRRLHTHDPTTVILDELGLRRRRARADVTVVNGTLHGYEIKSDRDSLRRLPTQVELYGEVFDRATLVTAPRYADSAARLLPNWWEMVIVRQDGGSVHLETIREGALNCPRARTQAEFIWREDALRLLEERGAARGLHGKPRRVLWDRLCAVFSPDEIATQVKALLKARAGSEAAARP